MSEESVNGHTNRATRRTPTRPGRELPRRMALLLSATITMVAALLAAVVVAPPAGATSATGATDSATTVTSTQAAPGAPASAAFTLLQGLDVDGNGAASVDVLLDRRVCALRGVPYASLSRRLSVPAGIHRLDVVRSDGQCSSGVTLVSGEIDAASDSEITVVLRRGPGGGAVLEHHMVDLSPLSRCEVRLRVHNLTSVALDDVVVRHVKEGWSVLELSRLDPGEATWATTVVDADYRLEARHPSGPLQAIASVPEGRVSTIYVVGDHTPAWRIVIDTRVSRNFTG
ncbi:MAG: hypothetical protein ACKV2O_13825 [Acidimicrobiales bacterium]